MSDGEDGAMDGFAAVATQAEQKASEAGRVVLRGVQVIVLDDLMPATRAKVLEVLGSVVPARQPQEAWIPVAAKGGTYDEAILNAADGIPGKYRAVKVKAWREQTPRHVEPPLS